MKNIMLFTYLYPILFGVISLFYLIIGIRGIVQKKPFLISSRWTIGMFILCFLPSMITPFLFQTGHRFDLSSLMSPVMFLCIFIYMLILRRGYMAFAITDTSLREALHQVLKEMNITFEETIGSIKLTSIQAELQVSVQTWIGLGQIRIKPYDQNSKLLSEIVKNLNIYFQKTNTQTNLVSCIFYVVFAILMVIPAFTLGSLGSMFPKDGITKYYYDSGAVHYEYNYIHGQREGLSKEYSKEGKLKSEWPYHNGEINGVAKEYYDSGELRYEYTYVNDKQEGLTKEFFKDGRLKGEWTYKDGEYTTLKENLY